MLWWQADGFGADSVRLIKALQREGASLQILLFSATFGEQVSMFAQAVAGADANQVLPLPPRFHIALQQSVAPVLGEPVSFVPDESAHHSAVRYVFWLHVSTTSKAILGTLKGCRAATCRSTAARQLIGAAPQLSSRDCHYSCPPVTAHTQG